MGRWMEVLRERPADDEPYMTTRPEIIVAATAPHPLMYATRYMGQAARAHFPLLNCVDASSSAYIDEDLWLNSEQVAQLLDEFRKFRQLCHYEHFIPGVSGGELFSRWCNGSTPTDFEDYLNQIEQLLQTAVEHQFWIRLML